MADPRAIILQRRARFVAATLAATSVFVAPTARADDDAAAEAGDLDAGDLDANTLDASDAGIPVRGPVREVPGYGGAGDGSVDSSRPQACLCAMAPDTSYPDPSMAPAIAGVVATAMLARRKRRARSSR